MRLDTTGQCNCNVLHGWHCGTYCNSLSRKNFKNRIWLFWKKKDFPSFSEVLWRDKGQGFTYPVIPKPKQPKMWIFSDIKRGFLPFDPWLSSFFHLFKCSVPSSLWLTVLRRASGRGSPLSISDESDLDNRGKLLNITLKNHTKSNIYKYFQSFFRHLNLNFVEYL